MSKVMGTRAEAEKILAQKFLGKTVTFRTIRNKDVTGRIHRIAAEPVDGELMVIFNLDHTRYECDLQYFLENVTRHGNTSGTNTGDTGIQEGD